MGWQNSYCQACGDTFSYLAEWTRGRPDYCPSCVQDAHARAERRMDQRRPDRPAQEVHATCTRCGRPFSYYRAGSGRPRAHCLPCKGLVDSVKGRAARQRWARTHRASASAEELGQVDLEYF